jgi:hypothetical protein
MDANRSELGPSGYDLRKISAAACRLTIANSVYTAGNGRGKRGTEAAGQAIYAGNTAVRIFL